MLLSSSLVRSIIMLFGRRKKFGRSKASIRYFLVRQMGYWDAANGKALQLAGWIGYMGVVVVSAWFAACSVGFGNAAAWGWGNG